MKWLLLPAVGGRFGNPPDGSPLMGHGGVGRWSAATISLGQGTAQGGGEFGDLLLGHLGRQDRLRPVEGAGPLVQFD
jgi:hypothetical protein